MTAISRRTCVTSDETSSNTQDIQDPDYCVEYGTVICKSDKPAIVDGTAICRHETCRRRWNWCGLWAQELQVLVVRQQRGQSLVCVKTWPSIVETTV